MIGQLRLDRLWGYGQGESECEGEGEGEREGGQGESAIIPFWVRAINEKDRMRMRVRVRTLIRSSNLARVSLDWTSMASRMAPSGTGCHPSIRSTLLTATINLRKNEN